MASCTRPEENGIHALDVPPLNSMPYIGSPTSVNENGSLPTDGDTEPATSQTIILLSTEPTPDEVTNILNSIKGAVILCGSAATGMMGPHIGKFNIVESDDSYRFIISLPGVLRDEKDFSCDVDDDGKVTIKGVITTGEQIVCKYSKVFKMLSQNLGPPGRFSLAFNLPGPVDGLQYTGRFINGGLLEGIVKKR